MARQMRACDVHLSCVMCVYFHTCTCQNRVQQCMHTSVFVYLHTCVKFKLSCTLIYQMKYFFSVSTPSVTITALNTQTVGQSLTLQCKVTTVRGITSRVDIVWSSNGIVSRRIIGTIATTMDNSLVYTDSYIISQLSTTDDGRVIQCEVVINASPPVMATDNITLNVMGMYIHFLSVLL